MTPGTRLFLAFVLACLALLIGVTIADDRRQVAHDRRCFDLAHQSRATAEAMDAAGCLP